MKSVFEISGRAGYSRAEGMVLLGVALLVLSLAVPGWFAWRQRQRLAIAAADVRSITEAGRRYFREYGVWPSTHVGEMGDARYGERASNAEVMNALRAVEGEGNPDHSLNAQRIVFLEVPAARKGGSGIDEAGAFIDPWGVQYQIAMDTDLDNSCDISGSIYGRLIGEGIAVWSCGPDGKSDTADDILSWKAEGR